MPSYQLSQIVDRAEWIARYPRLSREKVESTVTALVKALGDSVVVTRRDELLAFSYDATGERHWPDVAIIPETVEQVQTALAVAHQHGMPIIGRGASTNLSGGTTPLVGGMIVSFTRLNRILEVNYKERWVRVQPGVVNAELSAQLQRHGFFYPPDPGSHKVSTLGGNIAENSGGPHCVKYGVTTHHTLALQVALSDGSLVDLPRIGDTAGGIDIASLLVGSEGTLGLVTEAVLAIHPLPIAAQTALVSFKRVEDAMQSVSALVQARVRPAALELMDQESVRVAEEFVHAGYPLDVGAVLLIELDGSEREISQDIEAVRQVCEKHGALSLQVAASAQEADNLWRGRRAQYGAAARLAPHLWVQDVTVPRPRLGEMLNRVLQISEQMNLQILTVAHAGDGNLHPDIPYDPKDKELVARIKAADRAILTTCVELGGSITGEHGVGIDKAEYLPLMYSPWELEAMNELKSAFDPEGLLNPLKALWPAGSVPVLPEPKVRPASIDNLEQLQEVLLWAAKNSRNLAIRGQGLRSAIQDGTIDTVTMTNFKEVYDFDLDNLSIEVGAGMPAGELASLLHAQQVDVPGLEPFMEETVGGLVASNAPYWRHSGGHGWRDYVLALEWVDARGRVLRFGRKTMKNVAGYDVAKLMVGSGGKLGAITRVTLRLVPHHARCSFAASDLLTLDEAWGAALGLLSRADHPAGILLVRYAGQKDIRLWCASNGTKEDLREQMKNDVPGTVTFSEGEQVWEGVEKARLSAIYAAIAQGFYETGRTPATGVDLERLFANESETIYFCPENGRWEALREEGAIRHQDISHADVERLRRRVARIFDPHEMLR